MEYNKGKTYEKIVCLFLILKYEINGLQWVDGSKSMFEKEFNYLISHPWDV